jgi:hypothetical protein
VHTLQTHHRATRHALRCACRTLGVNIRSQLFPEPRVRGARPRCAVYSLPQRRHLNAFDAATAGIWETSGRCVELSGRQTLNPRGFAVPGSADQLLGGRAHTHSRALQGFCPLLLLFFRALQSAFAARRTAKLDTYICRSRLAIDHLCPIAPRTRTRPYTHCRAPSFSLSPRLTGPLRPPLAARHPPITLLIRLPFSSSNARPLSRVQR